MKQTFFLFFLLLISYTVFGNSSLLPASKRVKEAYLVWRKQPESAIRQQAFINAFPATKKVFLAVFYPDDFS